MALIAGSLPEVLQRTVHPQRFALQFVSSWHAVGPAVILLAAGDPGASWSRFTLVVAAVAAQFGVDLASSAIRARLVLDVPLGDHLRALGWVYLVDAALTPCGFAVAVAAFHAMTSDRPYRRARAVGVALAEVERCAGTQFDPRVVAALGRVVERARRSSN